MYSLPTKYQSASLTILPTVNYNLPFMGHKIPYLSSLLVTCHLSSRLYGAFHVIYVQAHLPNEPNKLWRTDSIFIPFSPTRLINSINISTHVRSSFIWTYVFIKFCLPLGPRGGPRGGRGRGRGRGGRGGKLNILFLDFLFTVKAAPHKCVIWISQPLA